MNAEIGIKFDPYLPIVCSMQGSKLKSVEEVLLSFYSTLGWGPAKSPAAPTPTPAGPTSTPVDPTPTQTLTTPEPTLTPADPSRAHFGK